ncbi:MAG: hypothetical protein AB9866_24225 [Syntrophobacteraceae bacterium]
MTCSALRRKPWIIGLALAIVISFGIADLQGAGTGGRKKGRAARPAPKPAGLAGEQSATTVKLELYKGKFFTVKKPVGWQIITAGNGPMLSIWMRDPQNPARQAFMFGTVGPFYLSQKQKDLDHKYMVSGGYWLQWSDMPVVNPATAGAFLNQWNTLIRTDIALQFAPELPLFENLSIISIQPVQSRFGGQAELVRALFSQNGEVVEGLFVAEIVEYVPFRNGLGGRQGYAYLFSGIAVPKRELSVYQEPLMRSLESFNLSEQYAKDYITTSGKAFQDILRAGQTLRETSDIITKGWNARQKVHDVLSEKTSDAMLGKERLYDPGTGETYEFPNGWYDKYDNDRDKYNNPNLQPIPDENLDAWISVPLDGINQVFIRIR